MHGTAAAAENRVKNLAFAFIFLLAPLLCRASDGAAGPDNRNVLGELNLARTHPRQYAAILAGRMRDLPGADDRAVTEAESFLMRQQPLDPLQSIPALVMTAREHVEEQGATGGTGHRGPDGRGPWARMAKWGHWTGSAGENICYGYSDARSIVATLIVDQGVPGRGHRHNIFSPDFKVAGAACGPHARYGAMCVIDFAGGFVPRGERVATADPGQVIPEY